MTGVPASTIAIDGPAASGKSTIGELLAQRLGYLYFDTGAMYRALTWAALVRGISVHDDAATGALAEQVVIDIVPATQDDGRQYTVLVDGEDVTWQIRRAEVDRGVSPVSACPAVRRALTVQQRRIGRAGRVVMVGRDIGTVVLPDAELKLYLDAAVDERARRRYREKQEHGERVELAQLRQELRRRDEIDSTRAAAPLRPADDAYIVDTTNLTIAEALERALALALGQPRPADGTVRRATRGPQPAATDLAE